MNLPASISLETQQTFSYFGEFLYNQGHKDEDENDDAAAADNLEAGGLDSNNSNNNNKNNNITAENQSSQESEQPDPFGDIPNNPSDEIERPGLEVATPSFAERLARANGTFSALSDRLVRNFRRASHSDRKIKRTSSEDSPSTASTKSSASDEELGDAPVSIRPIQEKLSAKIPRRKIPNSKNIYMQTPENYKSVEVCFHGTLWTTVAVVSSWLAVALLILVRNSKKFVSFEHPLYIDPTFEEVYEIGIINMELCYNQTYTTRTGCIDHKLTTEDVQDSMFQLARTFLGFTLVLGFIASVGMTLAIFWTAIRLRLLGIVYLITYLTHAFSFLFFDSGLCKAQDCNMGPGSIISIFSSILWIVTCVAASKMDLTKFEKEGDLKKAQRRAVRYQQWYAHHGEKMENDKKLCRQQSLNAKVELEREASDETAETQRSDGEDNGGPRLHEPANRRSTKAKKVRLSSPRRKKSTAVHNWDDNAATKWTSPAEVQKRRQNVQVVRNVTPPSNQEGKTTSRKREQIVSPASEPRAKFLTLGRVDSAGQIIVNDRPNRGNYFDELPFATKETRASPEGRRRKQGLPTHA